MHLTIPIETAPKVLYMSIQDYRATVLEYYVDNARHHITVLYLTSLHFRV
jgi:hypothetical protein